jgi:hypothetical protein
LDEIFAEKYETKIMRKEIFMDPTLCFIFLFCLIRVLTFGRFFKNRIKTIEHTSLKFYLTNNPLWWRLVPTNGSNKLMNLITEVGGNLTQ